MNKFKIAMNKTAKFLRKNIYYVLIIVAVAAIATVVGVTLSQKTGADVPAVTNPIDNPGGNTDNNPGGGNPDDNPDDTKPAPVIFVNPIENAAVLASYSDSELVFSKTLEQWSTHQAIDFAADEGTAVSAVYAGTVTAIDNDALYGYSVTVAHDDGLVTRYCGLNDNISVSVAQKVTAGTKLGEVGNTMTIESADGPHLHFETLKNGKLINPAEYFITEEK